MMNKKHLVALFCLVLICFYTIQDINANQLRKNTCISQDWQYSESSGINIENIDLVARFVNVSLPHTWNAFDAVDPVPGYRRDTSWYHRESAIFPNDTSRYYIYFEGSNITTRVYINKKLAGFHIGGYTGFSFDITNLLRASLKT